MTLRYKPSSATEKRKVEFIRDMGSSSLKQLKTAYLSILEDGGESDTPQAMAAASLVCAIVEAIAVFKFGEQWVRP